jgi:ribosomal protein S18 acetylase RimI-like enzyme
MTQAASIDVRRLTEADAPALYALRGEALETAPASFGESLAEYRQTTVDRYAERLRSAADESFVIGGFERTHLIAMAGFIRNKAHKRRHSGRIWGVYVSAPYRCQGIARAVMAELLKTARTVDGLERVVLTVTQTPSPARELYLSLGFQPFGFEPKALKLDGRHLNEEYMALELGVAKTGQ